MTTGDKLWTDKDSRAELQLGSAVIRLNSNTGFSFLNLDDNTVQIQLTSGSVNVRVRRLDRDDVVEIDTPNLAFSVTQAGSYRVEANEDGSYSVVSIREGGGESTGNGQTYTLHAGQRGTFSGTDSLNAEVIDIGGRDQFDNWAYNRDRRYDESRSARYLSHDVVGYEDLDDYGDWRDDSNYGHVWFPHGLALAGRLITKVIGSGFLRGDIRGWMTHHGATRRFTTDAGSWSADGGVGWPDRSQSGRYMLPRWWSLLAVEELELAWAAMWDGFRWVRGKFMCRRTTSAGIHESGKHQQHNCQHHHDHQRLQHHHHQ